MSQFDLGKYSNAFPEALLVRYGRDFKRAFDMIEDRYEAVRSGRRPLTVEDVLAIFEPDLPFVEDWTMPDRNDLAERMEAKGAQKLIADLRHRNYDLDLLQQIIYCFRELSLTALVLQHVYPERFALCSHHLASQLYVAAPSVPKFYVKYCEELREWSKHSWRTPIERSSVAKAEFALWTWYRLAYHGKASDRRKLQREFSKDSWVQERRAKQIASALGQIDEVVLARSFVGSNAVAAASIGWRALGIKVRQILDSRGVSITREDTIWDRFEKLSGEDLPEGWTKSDLKKLWWKRNPVMKEGAVISSEDAARLLDRVEQFIDHNTHENARSASG
jgi:hypothetical protein